ncbi:MAG: hypothetical protein DLM54_02340 [Acidimicrobiales bacterium]|nr:MAG: hypothetical protein DLM54_02340 [Acidimicrobiales bacterium]
MAGTGSFRSFVRFDPDQPVVASVTAHRSTKVFVVCLEVDQELPQHPAPMELTLLVIEGQPTVTVADKATLAAAGDVMVMAVGTPHSLKAGAQRAIVVGVLQARE